MTTTKKITISLLTIISFALTTQITFADDAPADDPKNPFANAYSDTTPCISDEDAKSGKLIQFIEEPFGNEQPSKNGFEIRDCARNTIQYIITIGEKTKIESIPRLTKTCSSNAAKIADANSNTPWRSKFTCQQIQVIISEGGTDFIYGYIGTFYSWAAGLVGIIAVTVIIFSGIQITVSGGEPDTVSKAKTRIIKSLSGIALLFLSALILNTINPNFFTG